MTKDKADELRSLYDWATARQKQFIDKSIELGSMEKASAVLGLSRRCVGNALGKLKRRASRQGWSRDEPLSRQLDPGFMMKRRSVLERRARNEHGQPTGPMEPILQWRISEPDKEERFALLLDAFSEIAADYEGVAPPRKVIPERAEELDPKLLNVVPLGDLHFGMLSWAAETGSNFDLEIAQRNLATAIDDLFARSLLARECLIINVGDGLHADNSKGETTRGTKVDVDSRRPKMVRVYIDALIRTICRALDYHEIVHYKNESGNHDAETSILVTMVLAAWFRNNPRVQIDESPAAYHFHRHGKVLIGSTHGDKSKPIDLQHVMSCDRPRDWGETLFRHWYTGHIHHKTVTDYPGVTVETLRVLPPTDAWHFKSGYRSARALQMDTWHADYGFEVQHSIGIRRIHALQDSEE